MNIWQKWKNLDFTRRAIILVVILGPILHYFSFFGLSFPPCGEREYIDSNQNMDNISFSFNSDKYTRTLDNQGCTKSVRGLKYLGETNPVPAKIPVEQNQIKYTIIKSIYKRPYGLFGFEDAGWRKYFILSDQKGNKYYSYCVTLELDSTIDKTLLNCETTP